MRNVGESEISDNKIIIPDGRKVPEKSHTKSARWSLYGCQSDPPRHIRISCASLATHGVFRRFDSKTNSVVQPGGRTYPGHQLQDFKLRGVRRPSWPGFGNKRYSSRSSLLAATSSPDQVKIYAAFPGLTRKLMRTGYLSRGTLHSEALFVSWSRRKNTLKL